MLATHFRPEDYAPEPSLPNAWQVPLDYDQNPGVRRINFNYQTRSYYPPAVTIATPLYKTWEHLHETSRSIFNQSMQEFEWLIIDDGNTLPEVIATMQNLVESDNRIKIIRHGKNLGLSAARNTAINNARTDYVLFLDSDDTIEPGTLEKLLWRMYSWPTIAFVRGYSVAFNAYQYVLYAGFHMGSIFLTNNMASNSGLMLRPSRLNGIRYNENRTTGLEDWEFWLHCANAGIWGGSVYECCDWYRRRSSHADRWSAYDPARFDAFLAEMHEAYPALWAPEFKFPELPSPCRLAVYPDFPQGSPCENKLDKTAPRILLLTDKLDENIEGWLQAASMLVSAGMELSVLAVGKGSHCLGSTIYAVTPDVFVLQNFLDVAHYAAFVTYFIVSRQPDVVVAVGDIAVKFLPYLFAHGDLRMRVVCCADGSSPDGLRPVTGSVGQEWMTAFPVPCVQVSAPDGLDKDAATSVLRQALQDLEAGLSKVEHRVVALSA